MLGKEQRSILHFIVVANEKETFGLKSTTVANITFFYWA